MKKLFAAFSLLSLTACSSIIEGTNQQIVVNTNPPGADCALMRENIVIGRVNPTPGAVTIQKTKHDINVVCNKKGYEEATFFNNSDAAGATFGNIIAGGGIGWAIDSASGADNKYTSPVNITLARTEKGVAKSKKSVEREEVAEIEEPSEQELKPAAGTASQPASAKPTSSNPRIH